MFNLLGPNINSITNQNPNPTATIFPQRHPSDPIYSVNESSLRSAIFIPPGFKYGKDGKTPVVLVPGTGSYGGEAFDCNFAKLLKASTFADPVWLNIPGRMCDESPRNAEYVAYAINYIAVTTGKQMAIVAWSQGNLATQWTLKYWETARAAVNNFIALSADFHGTLSAFIAAPLPGVPCTPSVWHQRYDSNFIRTLRANGGDSAYVPTTSIYSATDEVVQPQTGLRASAYLNDVRKVGVTNCELQACAMFRTAGTIYTHETVMINPISWALAEDAIKNGGPGRLDRIDVNSVGMLLKAPGLSILDVTLTQALQVSAGASILTYLPKPFFEPQLPVYASMFENKLVSDIPVDPSKKASVVVSETEVPAVDPVA